MGGIFELSKWQALAGDPTCKTYVSSKGPWKDHYDASEPNRPAHMNER